MNYVIELSYMRAACSRDTFKLEGLGYIEDYEAIFMFTNISICENFPDSIFYMNLYIVWLIDLILFRQLIDLSGQ